MTDRGPHGEKGCRPGSGVLAGAAAAGGHGDEHATEDEVISAAMLANAHEFIRYVHSEYPI